MVNVNNIFGSNEYLKASDLGERDFNLTIKSVGVKEFDDGNKLLVHFQGADKGLVCNKTNAGAIARMHGDDTDNWIGKKVCLFKAFVDFRGDTVEAIRIRPSQQTGQVPVQPTQPAQAVSVAVPSQPGPQPVGDSVAVFLDDDIPFAPQVM